ncbi:MAG: hypothetical protein ACK4UK_01485 [Flavobacterium sp.]
MDIDSFVNVKIMCNNNLALIFFVLISFLSCRDFDRKLVLRDFFLLSENEIFNRDSISFLSIDANCTRILKVEIFSMPTKHDLLICFDKNNHLYINHEREIDLCLIKNQINKIKNTKKTSYITILIEIPHSDDFEKFLIIYDEIDKLEKSDNFIYYIFLENKTNACY